VRRGFRPDCGGPVAGRRGRYTLRDAVARGTIDHFGYVAGAHVEGSSLIVPRPELIRFGAATPPDEVDLGLGCFLMSAKLATEKRGSAADGASTTESAPTTARSASEGAAPSETVTPSSDMDAKTHYQVRFNADAAQLFRALPALQNLADRADMLSALIEIHADAHEPFDRGWLRNAVTEHLDEAGIDAESRLY